MKTDAKIELLNEFQVSNILKMESVIYFSLYFELNVLNVNYA